MRRRQYFLWIETFFNIHKMTTYLFIQFLKLALNSNFCLKATEKSFEDDWCTNSGVMKLAYKLRGGEGAKTRNFIGKPLFWNNFSDISLKVRGNCPPPWLQYPFKNTYVNVDLKLTSYPGQYFLLHMKMKIPQLKNLMGKVRTHI